MLINRNWMNCFREGKYFFSCSVSNLTDAQRPSDRPGLNSHDAFKVPNLTQATLSVNVDESLQNEYASNFR